MKRTLQKTDSSRTWLGLLLCSSALLAGSGCQKKPVVPGAASETVQNGMTTANGRTLASMATGSISADATGHALHLGANTGNGSVASGAATLSNGATAIATNGTTSNTGAGSSPNLSGTLSATSGPALVTGMFTGTVAATGAGQYGVPLAAKALGLTPTTGAAGAVTPGGAQAPITTNVKTVAAIPAAPVPSCQTLTFHHKSTTGHATAEACHHHRNQLVLPTNRKYALKTMCVRVDGKPVRFSSSQPGGLMTLLLGPVAGPDSQITVRYTEGSERCNADCALTEAEAPHDGFMDAIGGTAPAKNEEGKAKVAAWGKDGKDDDADLSGELDADLRAELSDENAELLVYNGWAADAELAHK